MNIVLEELSKNNLDIAMNLQHDIFPEEHGDIDFKNSITGNIVDYFSFQKHWIVKVDDRYVGITGIYSYGEYPEDAWLAWFGIIKSERRKGYASATLNKMFEIAKDLGYKHFRVYTDEIDNKDAVKFYTHMGLTSEVYDNPDDECRKVGNILVLSISIDSKPVSKWNNKFLHLGNHDKLNHII